MQETIFDPEHPITKPGIYIMTEQQYRDDPCLEPSLNASVAKCCLPLGSKTGTAAHMKQAHPKLTPPQEEDESPAKFDLGSTFHTLILGKGAEIAVVDAKDWRTNSAKYERSKALEEGRQPVLLEQMKRAKAMMAAAWPQIEARPELLKAMQSGRPERVIVWEEKTEFGTIRCRSQLDWVPDHGDIFPDWKSTGASAGPGEYSRTFFDVGGAIQDVFYRRGIRAVLGRPARMVFPVIENYEPFLLMVHNTGPASLAMAERQVGYAIRTFAACLHSGIWPGYPLETATQEAPPWVENKWTDAEDAGLTGSDFTSMSIEACKNLKLDVDRPEWVREFVTGEPSDG